MHRISRLALAVIALPLMVSVASAASKAPSEFKLGFSAMQLANPWFEGVRLGMEKACHELGIKCVTTDAFYRVDKQIGDIERMIDEHFDAIFCTAIDAYALIQPFENAKKAGIAVGSIAQTVPNSTLLYSLDEYSYGVSIATQAMHWARHQLRCRGKVALITQDNVAAVKARGNGIENTVKKLCPAMDIVARQAGDYPEAGERIIRKVLQEYPDLNLVIASNDSGGIGGYRAMVESGKVGEDRAVFSGDATREALELMRDPGSIYRGTVDLYPFKDGYETVKILYKQATSGLPAESDSRALPYVPVPLADVVSGRYQPSY